MYKILKTLDVKTWIILILTALLVLGIIFRPSKKIDYYKDEINLLHQKNKELMFSYDSLSTENKKIDSDLKKLYLELKSKEALINSYEKQITKLKNKSNETNNRVNLLNSDGVASEFTNYLKTKSGKIIRK
jgi:chromosome segregation ATPase